MSRSPLTRVGATRLLPGPALPGSPIRVEVVRYLGADGEVDRVELSPTDDRTGVVVLARDPDQRLAVVRQYRATRDAAVWELPRGFGSSASPTEDAARELAEETGARAVRLALLGLIHPDTGVQRQQVAVVRAHVEHPSTTPTDLEEIAAVAWWCPQQLRAAVVDGRVRDGISLAALHLDACIGDTG